mmetsp:Transcript_23586/g.44542  ORF Transcript_23586/g.44542 Transcript_23586/m.44542 type:complete len:114 (+) Transcript_23586:584-925(+)
MWFMKNLTSRRSAASEEEHLQNTVMLPNSGDLCQGCHRFHQMVGLCNARLPMMEGWCGSFRSHQVPFQTFPRMVLTPKFREQMHTSRAKHARFQTKIWDMPLGFRAKTRSLRN